MPIRLHQSSVARLGRAVFSVVRARFSRVRLESLACVPFLADAPVAVDDVMMSGIAALVLFVGVSIGLLYRRMQEKEERLSARATTAESELRALLTMTDDAVLVISSDGIIREVNPGAEELLLHDAAGLVGRKVATIIPLHLPLVELTRNGPSTFQTDAPHSEGVNFTLEVLLSQVALGEKTSYLAIVRPAVAATADVLAKPVRQACHDLNNHFTTLLGNLSLVLASGDADAVMKERILNAKKTGLRAQQTVRRLHCLAAGEDPDAAEPAPSTIVQMPFALPQPPVAAHAAERPRVLILDDEEAIRQLVATVLESSGFDVATAGTGEIAVKMCEDALKSGRAFRVVVSDLCLPGQLDGSDAVLKMRALDPSLLAVVSSGHDSDPIMRAYHEHGFAAALAKPFEMGSLVRVINNLVSGTQPVLRSA